MKKSKIEELRKAYKEYKDCAEKANTLEEWEETSNALDDLLKICKKVLT